MARVLPAHEVGLPEGAGRVRVSGGKRPGRILAVEHPVFGWVNYREWALLGYVERLVERIGPLELVAWVGLTYQYAQIIKSAGDLAGWLNNRAGDLADILANAAFFIPEALTGVDIRSLLGGAGQTIQDVLGGLSSIVGGTVTRYFWAAVAAAMTILAVKRV